MCLISPLLLAPTMNNVILSKQLDYNVGPADESSHSKHFGRKAVIASWLRTSQYYKGSEFSMMMMK